MLPKHAREAHPVLRRSTHLTRSISSTTAGSTLAHRTTMLTGAPPVERCQPRSPCRPHRSPRLPCQSPNLRSRAPLCIANIAIVHTLMAIDKLATRNLLCTPDIVQRSALRMLHPKRGMRIHIIVPKHTHVRTARRRACPTRVKIRDCSMTVCSLTRKSTEQQASGRTAPVDHFEPCQKLASLNATQLP